MSERAASPAQKRNTWRERQEPGPRSAARHGAEPSRAPRSRDGLGGSGRARGLAPPGHPGGLRRAGGFHPRVRRCLEPRVNRASLSTQPRLPSGGDTHGVLSTGLPIEETSPEILTPLFRPCNAGPALVLPGARLTGGRWLQRPRETGKRPRCPGTLPPAPGNSNSGPSF